MYGEDVSGTPEQLFCRLRQ